MKRLFLLIIVILSISFIYIFIPGKLLISKAAIINCTSNGASRELSDENNWESGWAQTFSGEGNFSKNTSITDSFRITKKLSDGVDLMITHNRLQQQGSVRIFTKSADSIILEWKSSISSGWDPFTRIIKYTQAVGIKKNMDAVVENMRLFLEKPENVYRMAIQKSSSTDTLLVSAKYVTSNYPTTKEIYNFLDTLKKYISQKGAKQTGYPMLNITAISDDHFQTMVAIPTDKQLPLQKNIFPKRLIAGNFMVSEIHGGIYTINKALKEMQLYFEDYGKTSMAIPFQSLITDRNLQPDTSKWITKIYAPVMK